MNVAKVPRQSAQIREILISVRQLDSQEQLLLMQELATILRQQVGRFRPKRKVTEFRGVGKNAWRGVDVADYVRSERDSWG